MTNAYTLLQLFNYFSHILVSTVNVSGKCKQFNINILYSWLKTNKHVQPAHVAEESCPFEAWCVFVHLKGTTIQHG